MTAKQIKRIRRKSGLSQAAFAKKYKISYNSLVGWENGKNLSLTGIALMNMIDASQKK